MNIYDVSKKAGVSIATVSRVLNGSDKVSEKTKQKVLAVMDETNYTPNVFARGLGLNSMKTIGILCPDASDPFLANGIYYAEQTLRVHGYDTLLNCCGYETEEKIKSLALLMSKRIDGVMMIGSSFAETDEDWKNYMQEAAKKIPIVLVNGYVEGENIYCSFCNDFQATFDVTGSLLDKGRKNILFLYRMLSYSGRQKLNGYKAAFAARALEPDERYMVQVENDIQAAKETIRRLAEEKLPFDAILSCEDSFAVAGVKFAKEAGIRIPQEMEIVGYNNSILAAVSEPELTSIDSRVQKTTTQGAAILIDVLEGREAEQRNCIPCELKKRATTEF